jgi:hypothetical protein
MAEYLLMHELLDLIDRTLTFHLSVELNYFSGSFKCILFFNRAITQTRHLYYCEVKH